MSHAQIGTRPVPEIDAGLRRRLFTPPGVEERPASISVPGARGDWLRDVLPLERPEEIFGRESGIRETHPDGGLYATLLPKHPGSRRAKRTSSWRS